MEYNEEKGGRDAQKESQGRQRRCRNALFSPLVYCPDVIRASEMFRKCGGWSLDPRVGARGIHKEGCGGGELISPGHGARGIHKEGCGIQRGEGNVQLTTPVHSPGLTRGSKNVQTNYMPYYIYIMTNKPNGTLYVGVTGDLVRRVFEHKTEAIDGFTKKYKLKMLVYYECYDYVDFARQREKNIKHWSNKWKVELIEKMNPQWMDLYNDLF